MQTGIWGERLSIQHAGQKRLTPVRVPVSLGQWEQFLLVRQGKIEGPARPKSACAWPACGMRSVLRQRRPGSSGADPGGRRVYAGNV
ncbi:MAG: hypothetical protein R2873_34730 [Caldilineaceae bacterium]